MTPATAGTKGLFTMVMPDGSLDVRYPHGEDVTLFSNDLLELVMRNLETTMKRMVAGWTLQHLVQSSADELNYNVLEGRSIRIPRLAEDRIKSEVVEGPPSKITRQRPRHFVVRVPVLEGDVSWLVASPPAGCEREIRARVSGATLALSYPFDNPAPLEVQAAATEDIALIRSCLERLSAEAHAFNDRLSTEVANLIAARQNEAVQIHAMAEAVGLPLVRREGTQQVYVPLQRRSIAVPKPDAAPSRGLPKFPALAADEYEHILSLLSSMSNVMERSPSAFRDIEEELLRFHFLIALNSHYDGGAMGEVFNASGKTDILIRSGDRNVFIAECKFWTGEKGLLNTTS